jgi:hypothetical protein
MELQRPSTSDTLQYFEWQRLSQEALTELDRDKLKQRVDAAEAAIFKRLRLLSHNSNHTAERPGHSKCFNDSPLS